VDNCATKLGTIGGLIVSDVNTTNSTSAKMVIDKTGHVVSGLELNWKTHNPDGRIAVLSHGRRIKRSRD
jgi:hypothetical protein